MNQVNYSQEIERDIKLMEASLMVNFEKTKQKRFNYVLNKARQQYNKEEVEKKILPLTRGIVDSIFAEMEKLFFDHKIQKKIEQKELITPEDLDNEWNQSTLLNYWSQKKLKRFYQLKKLYHLQEAKKY